jgi:hypothetical protein
VTIWFSLSYKKTADSSRKSRRGFAFLQADLPKACLQSFPLLLVEGHAVGALVLSGIAFMGAYQNGIQGAVVLGSAVVGALTYGTLDALVGVTVHKRSSSAFFV